MSVLLDLLLGEVIRPLIYGMGWALVYVFTLGRIRPKPGAFQKNRLVGLLGIYAWCASPALLVLLWRSVSG